MFKSIIIYVGAIFALLPISFGQNATVAVTKGDKKTQSVFEVPLTQTSEPNTKRFILKKEDIPADAYSLDIKFDFAKANKGDAGYFVLADGRLGTFKLDKGEIIEVRNPMPLFGMKKGDTAFVAIVKGLKYEFSAVARAENGKYEVFPRFFIGRMHRPAYEDIIIDVTFFEGDAANYSSMGKKYREYQLGRGEVKPIKERVKTQPCLAYAADTMYLRFAMSKKKKSEIKEQTLENEPPLDISMTFDETTKIINDLKALGVDKLDICYVGWNIRGIDGRFPSLFPVEPALGGEAKMKESLSAAHKYGFQTVAHVCNTDFYTISERFDINDIARDWQGKPMTGHVFVGGLSYSPCFEQVYKKYVPEDLEKLRELGIRGLHHIDVTSCIVPWDCHSPAHPCTRQDTGDWMNKIGLLAREKIGGFASEGPCDHVANSLDFALYVSAYPRYLGKANPMMDKIVPLWQIAYHGIILSNPFYSCIDPFYKNTVRSEKSGGLHSDVRERWLKIVEFGGRPVFYRGDYSDLAPVKQTYDAYEKVKHLQCEFIDFHGELAPNVFITKYSNGENTICNYGATPFVYEGKTIPPMDYILLKK